MFALIEDLLIASGPLIIRGFSATIAIISASFFLHLLVRDITNRVGRTFSGLLLAVMITYIGDLGVSYATTLEAAVPWLTFQWLGIVFVPAVYVHLSDAILELTGLPSRGRRRRVVRILYGLAAAFLLMVLFTDLMVRDPMPQPAPHFRPGPVFPLFALYFIGSVVTSFWFVLRARRRTITTTTRRRMTLLVLTYAAPALAAFPFLLISGQGIDTHLLFFGVLIVVDAALAIMLSFMAYLLSFFGARSPDRLIRAQMLAFFLRGPVVAIAVLAVILLVPGAGEVLRLPGAEVMPFLAVLLILLMQWLISLGLPVLERLLIYADDAAELRRIRELESRLLTVSEYRQILEALLAAVCDYLRVDSAFVASISAEGAHVEQTLGDQAHLPDDLGAGVAEAFSNGHASPAALMAWEGYWLLPLHAEPGSRLIGLLGVKAPAPASADHMGERRKVLGTIAGRLANILEDRRIQAEVSERIEGLIAERGPLADRATLERSSRAGFGDVGALTAPEDGLPLDGDFVQKVKDALGHYWGGPRLTDEALMRLSVVRRALDENQGNAQRAMRAVLQQAIENLKPEGQRSMTTTEWILYNILEMRFIQGRKVRDVAIRLAMSEADFYRKQRIAIKQVAQIIGEMERTAQTETAGSEPQAHH